MKLSLREVVKRFGAHRVIDRVSLELDGVHCLALIGPSGGGKSTLLRIVAGLEYPTSGAVVLNDKPIEYHDEALLWHRRSIGTVFQAFNLFPHLTRQFIATFRRRSGTKVALRRIVPVEVLRRPVFGRARAERAVV